ncbi:MAG: hypothetical protein AAB362_00050, partial [Patescibacteria group bacterium]
AEQSTIVRFVGELKKSYEKTVTEAVENKKKLREADALGKAGRTGLSVVSLIGNATLYGRTAYDIYSLIRGTSMTSPTRFVSMAAMALARGGEAAKEARLASAESIDQARIHDIDQAAEEAWKIYELAREKSVITHEISNAIQEQEGAEIRGKELSLEGGTAISKEDLEYAYKKQLGDDLLNRLAEKPKGLMQALAQRLAKFQINQQFKKINQEFFNAKYDATDSVDQRKREELVLKKHTSFLRNIDRFVGNSGTIDLIAYGSGLLEKGGKTIAIAMTLDTLARGTLWLDREFFGEKTNKILADIEEKISGISLDTQEIALETTADVTPKGDEPSIESRSSNEPLEDTFKKLSEKIAGGEKISEKSVLDAITPEQHTTLEEIEKTMMERSINEDVPTTSETTADEMEKTLMEKSISEEAPIEASAPFTETVQKGDSVWNIIDRKLEKEYGVGFDSAKKTFIIDTIKDRIAANPEEFGLDAGQNIDQLEIGQEIDFSTTLGNDEYVDQLMQKSGDLSEKTLRSITENDAALNEWRVAHPDAPLTTEQTEEILSGEERATKQLTEKQIEVTENQKSATDDERSVEELATKKTTGQKTPEQTIQTPPTESLEEKTRLLAHIETNRAVLLELGLHERVIQTLPDDLLAKIKPLHINAYEIAYHDLGIKNFNNETAIQNYTTETFTILTSGNKSAVADWVREYRSAMIENATENDSITPEYIDGRINELKKYLDISSIEKTTTPTIEAPIETETIKEAPAITTEPAKTPETPSTEQVTTDKESLTAEPVKTPADQGGKESQESIAQTSLTPEASTAIELARNTMRDHEIKYEKMIEQIKNGNDPMQNSILRESRDSRIWNLDMERRVAKAISENPEKYAKHVPEENSVVFEGSIMIPSRPGSPIKELKQPFNIVIENISAHLLKK